MQSLSYRISQRRRIRECPYSEELSKLVTYYKGVGKGADTVSEDELGRAIGHGEPLNPQQLEIVARHFRWSEEKLAMMQKLTEDLQTSWKQVRELAPENEVGGSVPGRAEKDSKAARPILGNIRYQNEELEAHRAFFGRDGLLARLMPLFSERKEGRYMLLVASPFFGKSAIAAQLVQRLPNLAAYHFVKRGQGDSDSPDVFLRSLATQIRWRYNLPDIESDHPTAEGLFHETLLCATRSLPTGKNLVVLVDGLDEAFGLLGRLPEASTRPLLPRELPPRCTIIILSRGGKHMDELFDSAFCEKVHLEKMVTENESEIRGWIMKQECLGQLQSDDVFVNQMAQAAEGLIGVAVRLLRDRPGLADELKSWQENNKFIPRGLGGLLQWEWQRLISGAQRKSVTEQECRRLLGLLALAREPINWATLQALLLQMDQHQPNAVFSVPGVEDAVKVIRPDELLRKGEVILDLAREYFLSRNMEKVDEPFHFFHAAFGEHIQGLLIQAAEREFCEILLSQACSRWHDLQIRRYAVRYRFKHLSSLGNWQAVQHAFSDLEFLQALVMERGHKASAIALKAAKRIANGDGIEIEELSEARDLRELFSRTGDMGIVAL